MPLTVSVVIVTYNGWSWLRECLASLAPQVRPGDEVIVVDNGSSDGIVENLAREFPWVVVVEAGSNLGFAAGNNLGVQRASGDVLLLVNNDIVAEPGFVSALLEPLEARPEVGAVAATMVFANDPDVVASAGIEVYDNGLALDRGLGRRRAEFEAGAAVFGASAGAAAYRRTAFEAAGGFAEPFFMYLEDVDLAWRLRLLGWEAVHAPGAVVRHVYSASAREASPFKRRLLARNRLWVLVRCLPRPLLRRCWWRAVRYDLMAAGYALVRGDFAALAGRVAALGGLPARLRERRQIQASARVPAATLARWVRPAPSARDMLRLRELTARLAGRDGGEVETAAPPVR